jgi:hypothetical protein
MKIPQGWQIVDNKLCPHPDPRHRDNTHYIKVMKSLYGIKQAATPGFITWNWASTNLVSKLWPLIPAYFTVPIALLHCT